MASFAGWVLLTETHQVEEQSPLGGLPLPTGTGRTLRAECTLTHIVSWLRPAAEYRIHMHVHRMPLGLLSHMFG